MIQINPDKIYEGVVLCLGLVHILEFDLAQLQWKAISLLKAAQFFNYSTHHGYHFGLG